MKNIRKLGKFLCIAIAGMLAFGDFATCSVYASQSLPSDGSFAEASDDVSRGLVDETEPADGTEPANETKLVDETEPTDGTEMIGMTAAADITQLTDEQLAEYYGDSVFIGDSIMQGFRNYSAKADTFVHDIQFLTAVSYSVKNALKPVNSKIPHPKYKGKKYHLWDVLPLLGKKRTFILLGTNDLVSMGPEDSRDKYKELIDKILETSPNLEIHIVSVTYTLWKDKAKGCLCNPNIDTYNALLQEMADENDWGYIDLCTPISDGEGNLAEDYCSDGFVHLTNAAYALWEEELINYANSMQVENEVETTCMQENP